MFAGTSYDAEGVQLSRVPCCARARGVDRRGKAHRWLRQSRDPRGQRAIFHIVLGTNGLGFIRVSGVENTMQLFGTLAFGTMTAVNLTVFVAVLVGIFRRTRVHH